MGYYKITSLRAHFNYMGQRMYWGAEQLRNFSKNIGPNWRSVSLHNRLTVPTSTMNAAFYGLSSLQSFVHMAEKQMPADQCSTGEQKALLIGAGVYPYLEPDAQLSGPANDVRQMADFLKGDWGFASSDVRILVEEGAAAAEREPQRLGAALDRAVGELLHGHADPRWANPDPENDPDAAAPFAPPPLPNARGWPRPAAGGSPRTPPRVMPSPAAIATRRAGWSPRPPPFPPLRFAIHLPRSKFERWGQKPIFGTRCIVHRSGCPHPKPSSHQEKLSKNRRPTGLKRPEISSTGGESAETFSSRTPRKTKTAPVGPHK